MLVDHINLLTSLLSVDSKPSFKALQIGQILHALVLGRNKHGLLELKIGTQRVTANTRQSFQPGAALKLIVIENDENLVLQVLNKNNQQPTKPLLTRLLRHSLPFYNPPAKLFKALNSVKLLNVTNAKKLPQTVLKQITKTMITMPDKQSISSSRGLKQAIENSGLFLEARLGKHLQSKAPLDSAQNIMNQDFKAGLLRINQTLEQSLVATAQAPKGLFQQNKVNDKTVKPEFSQTTNLAKPKARTVQAETHQSDMINMSRKDFPELIDLKRLVESAIARIQVNQTNAIVTDESQIPVWQIDLPINDEQESSLAQIRITYEERPGDDGSSERKWSMAITLDLENMGKIHIRVTQLGEEISSSIWAENDSTYRLIDQHLEQLSERLQRTGLNIDCINCFPGPMQTLSQLDPTSQSLVSIKI